jgi:hypothetical protein
MYQPPDALSLTYLYKNLFWKQRDIVLMKKTQMKPHTNYYKSLDSMKVDFVIYAWNLSLNIMHLKYIANLRSQ